MKKVPVLAETIPTTKDHHLNIYDVVRAVTNLLERATDLQKGRTGHHDVGWPKSDDADFKPILQYRLNQKDHAITLFLWPYPADKLARVEKVDLNASPDH